MVEIYEVTRTFAEKDHSGYDWFVFIALSVCSHDHEISGLDRRNASVAQVMSEFKATKCPSLQNKPKLFFVQRFTMPPSKFGESHDSSMLAPYCTDEAASFFPPNVAAGGDVCPEEADFLLTCVTSPVDEFQQVPESSFNQVGLISLNNTYQGLLRYYTDFLRRSRALSQTPHIFIIAFVFRLRPVSTQLQESAPRKNHGTQGSVLMTVF